MKKVFLALFGGTPVRNERCLYLNAAAGLYQGCEEIHCYPIDKDVKSPNYTKTRAIYDQYKEFQEIVENTEMASAQIMRTEVMFTDMLAEAGISSENEKIHFIMAPENYLSRQDQELLDICFTEKEQEDSMKGGYYGKANIGSITGDLLQCNGGYDKLEICKDIEKEEGDVALDVIIVCTSFGGTGASLGINFGEYLRMKFTNKTKMRLHCIFIQPYFSFPEPDENDRWKMDSKEFYAKSATITTIFGQKEHFIRNYEKGKEEEEEGTFDSFYYLGQPVLDRISEKNSAKDEQDNKIHMIDMLVSLAVQDIIMENKEEGYQLYGYQYSREGTEVLEWSHMPGNIDFRMKHTNMMRFCGFMLDCMEPIFSENFKYYDQEMLIMHMYGSTGILNKKRADVWNEMKKILQKNMQVCFEFCRSYMEYWIELEKNTRWGRTESSVTRFFNLNKLEQSLKNKESGLKYETIRGSAELLDLTEREGYGNYVKSTKARDIYDNLLHNKKLKGIAAQGGDKEKVAKTLVREIYEKCKVENQ